jgi:hypothetical protein
MQDIEIVSTNVVDTDGSAMIYVGWIRIHIPPDPEGQR